ASAIRKVLRRRLFHYPQSFLSRDRLGRVQQTGRGFDGELRLSPAGRGAAHHGVQLDPRPAPVFSPLIATAASATDPTHEAFRMPELRPAALLREYEVRELRPALGLSALSGSRHGIGGGRRRLARACWGGRALPVLRQRRARRLQLARACRADRDLLRRLPP